MEVRRGGEADVVGDGFDAAVGVGEFSDREVASNAVVDALEGCAIGVESADQGAWLRSSR